MTTQNTLGRVVKICSIIQMPTPMFFTNTDPAAGIIPRALHHLFTELGDVRCCIYIIMNKKLSAGNQGADATVRVSFVELYNEQIYDLLSASDASQAESLRIYDDKSKVI